MFLIFEEKFGVAFTPAQCPCRSKAEFKEAAVIFKHVFV